MTLSASFTVNSASNPAAHVATYGSTVNLAITSLTGVNVIEWSIVACSKYGDLIPTITLSGSPLGATASFAMPANPGDGLGRSFLVKLRVTDQAAQTAEQYAIVGAVNNWSQVPLVAGEETYRNATHGWSQEFNVALARSNSQTLAQVLVTGNSTGGTGIVVTTSDYIQLGTTLAASTGYIRGINSAGWLNRNNANTNNIPVISTDSSDQVIVGGTTIASSVLVRAGTGTIQHSVGGTLIQTISSTAAQLAATMKLDWASGTAALSIGGTNWLSSTASLSSFAQPVSVTNAAAAVASSGIVRLPQSTSGILVLGSARNGANSGDVPIFSIDTTDNVYVGSASAAASVILRASGTISLQNGSTAIAVVRATELELQAGIGLDWASGTANLTIAGTAWLSSTASLSAFAQSISVTTSAAAVASTGLVRLARNATAVMLRNEGNTADIIGLAADSSNNILIGDPTNAAQLTLRSGTGNVVIGVGGSTILTCSSASVAPNVATLAFASTVVSPLVGQSGDATSDVTGDTITFFGQAVTGGGTTVTGGRAIFRGGNASTATATTKVGGNADLMGGTGDASNPGKARLLTSGGTVYAQVDEVNTRFDITTSCWLNIVKGQALGGGAAATLGTIAGSGPTVAAQNKWIEIKSNGTTGWVPFWV